MTREELIAALERAEGPSRELDAEIWSLNGEAVMPFQPDPYAWMTKTADGSWLATVRPNSRPISTSDRYIPRYTASLDAALTLVSEGLLWALYSPTDYAKAQAQIETQRDLGNIIGDGQAATPAIALCIAALKARA